ncbi:MAG: DUF2254 domain-containing protein [Actinobacteria bacterium]|nr:DUF2254 domain-containing protein [Actinomycetota bacterium]
MRPAKLLLHIKSSLWFVPVLCVLAGAGISFGTIALDRYFDYQAIPRNLVGGPDAATEILGTVAASMVSLAALVLTITMVVVQLAMGQFSPRIVQRILQDKPSQLAIGLFVATFVHAILAVREVTNNGDGTGNVPGIAVVTAFVLVLGSVAVLVMYVHHIGQSLRVSSLIELVGKDTRKLLDRKYPDKGPPVEVEPGAPRVVAARRSGVVTGIGHEALVEEARRVSARLELAPALGEFVPAGAPLFRIRGEAVDLDENRLHESMILTLEPTLEEDVAYGVRLLVDELGGPRPPRVRRDPHGGCRIAAGNETAPGRARGSPVDRADRPRRGRRGAARAACGRDGARDGRRARRRDGAAPGSRGHRRRRGC